MTKLIIHFKDGTPDNEIEAVERIEFHNGLITFTRIDFEHMRRKNIIYRNEQIDWMEPRQY